MDKQDLKDAIEHKGIFRCQPPNRIPSRSNQNYNTWQFYLRRILLNPTYMKIAGQLLYEKVQNVGPFQLAACETAGISLGCAIQYAALNNNNHVNLVIVKKDKKDYGLSNSIEGTLNNESIILVDDLINSGQTIRSKKELLEQYGYKVSPQVLCVLAKNGQSTLSKFGMVCDCLFQFSDFTLLWQDYVNKWGNFPDFGKFI